MKKTKPRQRRTLVLNKQTLRRLGTEGQRIVGGTVTTISITVVICPPPTTLTTTWQPTISMPLPDGAGGCVPGGNPLPPLPTFPPGPGGK